MATETRAPEAETKTSSTPKPPPDSREQQAKALAEEQMQKDEDSAKDEKAEKNRKAGLPEKGDKYFPNASVVQPTGGDPIVEPVFKLPKEGGEEGAAPGIGSPDAVGPVLSEEDKRKAAEASKQADVIKAGMKAAFKETMTEAENKRTSGPVTEAATKKEG